MATRSNTPFDDSLLAPHEATPEKAPSVMVADRQSATQFAAFLGLFLVIVGATSLFFLPNKYLITPGWGFAFLTLGFALMIYHSFADPEYQFRRVYSGLAMLMGLAGVVASVLPASTSYGPVWLTVGLPLVALSPLFVFGVLRHEDEAAPRRVLQAFLGLMFLLVFGGSLAGLVLKTQFIASGGVGFFLLSALYAAGYIGSHDADSDRGYRAGLALGVIALGLVAGGLIASFVIEHFLVPDGLTLIGVGLLMGMISLGTCSDAPPVVLTRRELAAYFYSPIAYFVLLAMLAVFSLNFWIWSAGLSLETEQRGGVVEPIVLRYVFGLVPVLILTVFIPIVTMRLFSEEQRSGSLEVLLTAPVRETAVILSKFTAALLFSLLMWLPSYLFLFALRLFNPVEFDYRPMLSFAVVLVATHVNFVAMGLFFSSLTANQVIAAVLTFAGMVLQTVFFFYGAFTRGTFAYELFQHLSYLELWHRALGGDLIVSQILLHVSIGAFFLVLTGLTINSRRWK
jgi:ABC-2 type transport system permease protein